MHSDLLLALPGTLPDLLRRGSPVVFLVEVKIAGFIFYVGCRAVVEEISSAGEPVIRGQAVHPSAVGLDLSDITGRYHARLWLRKRWPQLAMQDLPDVLAYYVDLRISLAASAAVDGPAPRVLADIDPEDPRRLPDGSRWVEALGLQRICLYVENQRRALPTWGAHG